MNNFGFSLSIIEKIGYYVYFLIDPETKDVFYVGKGKGNRIFAHLNEAIDESNENLKLDRIRAIRVRGQDVQYIIHRHGLTEKEALEVEAALIDYIGLHDLTNVVAGHHSRDYGPMTIAEIMAIYDAPLIEIQEPAILVIINQLYHREMTTDELYQATRGDWVLGSRREGAKYVFAVSNRIVRQVYEVERWYPAEEKTTEPGSSKRWRFDGRVVGNMQHYVGGSVERYITLGAQNPIKYVNC
jgi:uncharacterized protein